MTTTEQICDLLFWIVLLGFATIFYINSNK